MSKIKSITLSNVRRFGLETTIEFSPGVTVLLAPNGTGKTSVFEAIEFGLTGKVARLEDDLLPIIRDTADYAQVQVNFDSAECTTQINRNGQIKVEGSLDSIFGDTAPADIPFLLRLTHLLDQRERDWFVQADAKVAGSNLAKLPVGRDGSQANNVLTGARRHISELLSQTQTNLFSARTEQEEWQSLLRESDNIKSHLHLQLKTHEQIAEELNDIADVIKDIDVPPIFKVQLESLEILHQTLSSTITTRTERLNSRLNALSNFSSSFAVYDAERDRIKALNQEISVSKYNLEVKTFEKNKVELELNQIKSKLRIEEQRRGGLSQQTSHLVELAKAKEELLRRKSEFLDIDENLLAVEKKLSLLREELHAAEQLTQLHENNRKKIQELSNAQEDFYEAEEQIAYWSNALKSISEITIELGNANVRLEQAGVNYQNAVQTHAEMERIEHDSRNRLQTLSSAADMMRQAVSILAAHMPSDRSDCPVCGVDHGADELHRRMQNSLVDIDPNLALAELDLKTATSKIKKAEETIDKTRHELNIARLEVSNLDGKLSLLQTEVAQIRRARYTSAESPELAYEALQRRMTESNMERQRLEAEYSNFSPLPSLEHTSQLKINIAQSIEVLHLERKKKAEVNLQLELATASLSTIEMNAPQSSSIQELSIEQLNNEQQLTVLTEKIQYENILIDRLVQEVSGLEKRIYEIEIKLAESRSRLSAFSLQWRNLSLEGEPSAEILSSFDLQLRSELASLTQQNSVLEKLQVEITAWKRAEQTHMVQNILDRRRGDLSIDEESQRLEIKINQLASTAEHLSSLSEALESLSRFLSHEIDNIHDHVVAVVPRWQSLLKRIVRDVRFSKTNLDFYSHYKKEHASVLVPLHGESVPAPSIASEAQMTDLQLTFLLSMAVNHRWSPWRALLLDDPTQHHDLVHAASVFDVLRDYIIDHGFQIIIATHDALQARFFIRKLQNDGIAATMVSLVPTKDGVKAVLPK